MALKRPRKTRALTIRNVLAYLRHMDEAIEHPMIVELKSDQSGCLKDTVSNDIIETWTNLSEFNDVINAAAVSDESIMPSFRKFHKE